MTTISAQEGNSLDALYNEAIIGTRNGVINGSIKLTQFLPNCIELWFPATCQSIFCEPNTFGDMYWWAFNRLLEQN
jgi:hypothetical protein